MDGGFNVRAQRLAPSLRQPSALWADLRVAVRALRLARAVRIMRRIASQADGPNVDAVCEEECGKNKASISRGFRMFLCLLDYQVVEVSGIEPLTSCMPCKRSPS
jgi:hypothetical protein